MRNIYIKILLAVNTRADKIRPRFLVEDELMRFSEGDNMMLAMLSPRCLN